MMLRPDAVVTSVTEVTPDFLRAHGARAVMVDLDDTLLAAGSDRLEPGFRDWLLSLRAARIPVVILSNGTHGRVARWAALHALVAEMQRSSRPRSAVVRERFARLDEFHAFVIERIEEALVEWGERRPATKTAERAERR